MEEDKIFAKKDLEPALKRIFADCLTDRFRCWEEKLVVKERQVKRELQLMFEWVRSFGELLLGMSQPTEAAERLVIIRTMLHRPKDLLVVKDSIHDTVHLLQMQKPPKLYGECCCKDQFEAQADRFQCLCSPIEKQQSWRKNRG